MQEEKNNRNKWLHLRLRQNEYSAIHNRFKNTTCQKFSDYVRKVLMSKPIVTTVRNQSHDALMAEAIKLRNELNNIGNNFNQAVKKLHTLQQIHEFGYWINTYEKDNRIIQQKIDEVKKHIQNLGEKWLQ